MSDRVGLVRCPEVRIYDHGPQHPLRPQRVLLTWDLIDAYGLGQAPGVVSLACVPADDATLTLVHTPAFVDATRRAGHGEDGPWGRFGYGPGDNPIFDRMHEAGALVVGASVAAAEAVWLGGIEHAFNAAGGLHHAMPDRASGFCVYDDPAVAIAWLLEHGANRVAYVDVDVHHGDGPQRIFYDDPRVLTVSIHEYAPDYGFFPGTGGLTERGEGAAEGSVLNVPLPPGTSDEGWLEAFRSVVPPAVRRFGPQILVTQLGCDTHQSDPLAHLRLSTNAYREAARILHDLAHDAASGRWLATGGGGYQWASVVPRAWTTYFAQMAGVHVPDEIPDGWRERAMSLSGEAVPATMSEPPPEPGPADRHALEVSAAVRRIAEPRGSE